ncbi:shikimate dehydrogenase [Candidatus Bathyarchaeota archaeon]|nr:shikimate dehydrogenase [Candidatus Bathyarchaeota archaeon]
MSHQMIPDDSRVYCLYGFPVSHSLSPVIFNHTFEKVGINGNYLAFPVKPENLKDAVSAARALNFSGFNVTMPHKTRIVELIDEVEPSARKIGCVNTVTSNSNGLVGHNTDGEGAARAIRAYGFDPKDKRLLLLGAGGSSRAIAQTLAPESDITVLSRNLEQARKIVDSTKGNGRVSYGHLTKGRFEESVTTSNLLINATPVQTVSLLKTLGSSAEKLPLGTWVFDLAYDRPLEKLPEGRRRISPLEMLVQQAALSYEIWMQRPSPFQLMRSILVQHMGQDWK